VTVKRLTTETHCACCGRPFPASRRDALFCSARCRKRSSRLACKLQQLGGTRPVRIVWRAMLAMEHQRIESKSS